MKLPAALIALSLVSSTAFADNRDEPETKTIIVEEKGSPFWKGVFASSAVVTAAVVGAGFYYEMKWRGDIDSIRVSKPGAGFVTQDDCGRTDIDDKNGVFGRVCSNQSRAKQLMIAGLVAMPIVAASAYLGFIRVSKREVKAISVIPTVTTQSAGATLEIRW